jgi:SAM-dependent methyltransferase
MVGGGWQAACSISDHYRRTCTEVVAIQFRNRVFERSSNAMQMGHNSRENPSTSATGLVVGANEGCKAADLAHRYDHIYSHFDPNEEKCPVSTESLTKARTRVRQVLGGFSLCSSIQGARVLDIGSGLGVSAEAFRELGGAVTGVDLSPVAVSRAKARFGNIDFRCAAFPEGLKQEDSFDLIWAVDLPILGLFESENIYESFLSPCLKRLRRDGRLIVGWHTDFSGQLAHGWMNWSFQTIHRLRMAFRASPALIPQMRFFWLSTCVCHICRVARRSAPIYFCVRASDWGPGI